MILKTLALVAALAAPQPAPLDVAALRLATVGAWEGKLEYRDYQ